MDRGLIILGALLAVSVASAAIWHLVVKSYAWAIIGSSLTVGFATYLGYPSFRGMAPGALILANACVLGAVVASGVGVPFKRRRMAKREAGGDVRMNAQRAEKVIHILSMLAPWLAFVVVWVSAPRHLQAWLTRGADLPAPTLAWLAFSGSAISLMVPALCTATMIWVLRKRSVHANWVAGLMLLIALLYTIIAHTAMMLPGFTMCGPV